MFPTATLSPLCSSVTAVRRPLCQPASAVKTPAFQLLFPHVLCALSTPWSQLPEPEQSVLKPFLAAFNNLGSTFCQA